MGDLDDDCQAGGPGLSLLDIAKNYPEVAVAAMEIVSSAYQEQVELVRQGNLAYEELLHLWNKSLEAKFKYKDALEAIAGACPHPCKCREDGCDRVCKIAREALG